MPPTCAAGRPVGPLCQTAYTASPLCAPARASFMSGQLPRRTRVYDNAAEFTSDIPTYAHHLRRAGYQTAFQARCISSAPTRCTGSRSG
jgi:choline-sulfatase